MINYKLIGYLVGLLFLYEKFCILQNFYFLFWGEIYLDVTPIEDIIPLVFVFIVKVGEQVFDPGVIRLFLESQISTVLKVGLKFIY